MKTIYKYQIKLTDSQTIPMPESANIICAQIQKGEIVLWAEVNTNHQKSNRHIEIHGTGNPISENIVQSYIGTVQLDGYVWHIFERTN